MPVAPYLTTQPVTGKRVYLHPSCQVIGDVKIADDASIWCNTVLRGDVNRIVVGRGSNVQDLTMCHVSHRTEEKPDGSPLIIGDYVTVGHSVILHGCRIGNECLIGMGSIIMDDVVTPRSCDGRRGQSDLTRQGAGERHAVHGAPGQGGTSADGGRNRVFALLRRALHAGKRQLPEHPGQLISEFLWQQ